MTAFIASRGLITQYLILRIIFELESKSYGELDLLSLTKKHSRGTVNINFIFSVVISWGLFIFWIDFWILTSPNRLAQILS